jgi:outer membrane protein assembly factor BamB
MIVKLATWAALATRAAALASMVSMASLATVALLASMCVLGCTRPASLEFTFSTDAPTRAGLLRLEDGVVVGNEGGTLLRLGLDGKERRRVQLHRELAATPARAGTTIVAATVAGEWVGVDSDSGEERWRLDGRAPVLAPLSADASQAYVVATDGAVMAISPASGGTVWQRLPPRQLGKNPAPIRTAPALVNGALVAGLGRAGLFAFDTEDGGQLWHLALGELLGFIAEGERLYVLTREGLLAAVRAREGKVEWQRQLGEHVHLGPSMARGLLWVGVAGNGLLALDPQDGSEAWRTELPAPLGGPVAEYRELVLVPTRGPEGRLLGLRPARPEPVLELRLHSPLRSEAQLFGDLMLVMPADGRVLGYELRRTGP